MIKLKLIKGLSYAGVVNATRKAPDIFVESKATAEQAVATGYFKLVEEQESAPQAAHIAKDQLQEMKLDELKKLAVDMGVDTKGLKSKSDFVAAIAAVEVVPGSQTDDNGEDDEVYYDEASPTMIELQEQ